MTLTDWAALTGMITGIIGMVLGTVATADMIMKNRVRLRVVAKIMWTSSRGTAGISTAATPKPEDMKQLGATGVPDRLAIEITNLSVFAVTVDKVCFAGKGSGESCVLFVPEVSPGFEWPPVIPSRRSVNVYHKIGNMHIKKAATFGRVYVETECGKRKYATSPALKWLVSNLKAPSTEHAAPDSATKSRRSS